MQLPFFFEESFPDSDQFVLSENSSRHIAQVLRMKEGEPIQLTNGNGYTLIAEIILSHKRNTEVKIIERAFIPKREPKVAIAISFIKNTGRFEWFLEKATEIGVSEIIPLLCTRTEKTHFREERMKTILVSAMLQSRQAWLPELSAPVPITELIMNTIYDQKFIAHCLDEEKTELKDVVTNVLSSKIILIGPEGDFTKDEIEAALEQKYQPVSLGETRLRTETAGLVAAVLLR
jgi:16S rRNA (uracil1498-N3)-methyltransferase